MSFKALVVVILLILFGAFVYLKMEVAGSPNSHFNQTTRFTLGAHSLLRTALGLHEPGDARAQYFCKSCGPIVIEWFRPQEENDISSSVLAKFANVIHTYSGRPVQVVFGGTIDDTTIEVGNLDYLRVKELTQSLPHSTPLFVYFPEDFSPRKLGERSMTFQETGIIVSLNEHRQFVKPMPAELDDYMLASMLNGFGRQIGLAANTDASCVMDVNSGHDYASTEIYNGFVPSDFCPAEVSQIVNLQSQYK